MNRDIRPQKVIDEIKQHEMMKRLTSVKTLIKCILYFIKQNTFLNRDHVSDFLSSF